MIKAEITMYTIEDMQRHVLDNGTKVMYTAVLNNGNARRSVEFSQSGPNIVAYEKETDLIHHLNLPNGINGIEDLLNGHEVSFRISTEETAKHYL